MEPKPTPSEPDGPNKQNDVEAANETPLEETATKPNTPESAEPETPESAPAETLGDISAEPESNTEANSPAAPTVITNKKKHLQLSRKQLFIAIILVVLLVIAGVVSFLLFGRQSDKATSVKSNEQTQAAQMPPLQKSVKIVEVKATYLDTPKKLGDLDIFRDKNNAGGFCDTTSGNCPSTSIVYYQIGTTEDGRQVIVILTPGDGGGHYSQLMLGKDGKYEVLGQMDSYTNDSIETMGVEAVVKQQSERYAANVTYNVTLKLSDLLFPEKVTVNGQAYKSDYVTGRFMEHGLSDITGVPTKVTPTATGTVGTQTFYTVVTNDNANSQAVETYGVFKNMWSVLYRPQLELSSVNDKPITVEWTNGKSSSKGYFSAAPGCGTYGYVTAKNVSASQLVAVGKSPDGQQLYQLPATHALSQELYSSDYNGGPQEVITDASLRNLTLQQFMDKHAYVIYKNPLGQYVILQRGDMFMRGGCGKPVVYLYPQQKTDVSVRVGADVVVSEPQYPAKGWQHVTAEPSGRLTYQGKQYESLFWEGYGHGAYPDITNGTVVPSAQAVKTIRDQLKAQGLNVKETEDFMEYWQPKLPHTPYVRLTWFSTGQMNQLAPLSVSPRPQTVIRVFLDFEGLQQPEKLPAQHFTAPQRQGFTVVEWGGLLRDGIKH